MKNHWLKDMLIDFFNLYPHQERKAIDDLRKRLDLLAQEVELITGRPSRARENRIVN